jgi:hypothetical protein
MLAPRPGNVSFDNTIEMMKWGLLLPGAPEPRLTELTRQGFRSAFQAALRSLSNRSIVVVGNYTNGPITAEPCRAKARPLHPRRSYFAPAKAQALWALVEAPGTAPGSDRLIATAIYRHSRLAPAPDNIRRDRRGKKAAQGQEHPRFGAHLGGGRQVSSHVETGEQRRRLSRTADHAGHSVFAVWTDQIVRARGAKCRAFSRANAYPRAKCMRMRIAAQMQHSKRSLILTFLSLFGVTVAPMSSLMEKRYFRSPKSIC